MLSCHKPLSHLNVLQGGELAEAGAGRRLLKSMSSQLPLQVCKEFWEGQGQKIGWRERPEWKQKQSSLKRNKQVGASGQIRIITI